MSIQNLMLFLGENNLDRNIYFTIEPYLTRKHKKKIFRTFLNCRNVAGMLHLIFVSEDFQVYNNKNQLMGFLLEN